MHGCFKWKDRNFAMMLLPIRNAFVMVISESAQVLDVLGDGVSLISSYRTRTHLRAASTTNTCVIYKLQL
ncbi:unnamed protein product, partial [Brenthis ino]